jgi:ArsR family transcriptional regulator, arsenate/arsenite/antimonite-responsive transcriptional repressor
MSPDPATNAESPIALEPIGGATVDWKLAPALFEALARPGRIAVFRLVMEAGEGGISPAELLTALRMTGSALTFHLRALSDVRLIRTQAGERRPDGVRTILVTADVDTIAGLANLLRTGPAGHP